MNLYFRQRDQLTIGLILGALLLLLWVKSFTANAFNNALTSEFARAVEFDQAETKSYAFQIDLATADWTEFALLPGIGKALAMRIIAFRDRQKIEISPDQLLEVKGIGPKKLSSIRKCFSPLATDDRKNTESGT